MTDIGRMLVEQLVRRAIEAAVKRPRPGNPRRRGKPGSEADGVPVNSPRNPTLSGGAAAMIEPDPLP